MNQLFPTDSTIEKKFAAIDRCNPHNALDDLLDIAQQDQDSQVRCHAIGRIPDAQALLTLAVGFASASAESTAVSKQLCAQLLSSPELITDSLIAECLNYLHTQDLANICIDSTHRALAMAALTCLQDDALLVQVIQSAQMHVIRCFAIEKLHDVTLITQLLEQMGEQKDSAVARSLQKQLQKEKKYEQQKNVGNQEAGALLAKLQALLTEPMSAESIRIFALLRSQQQAATKNSDTESQHAVNHCVEQLQQLQAQFLAQQAQEQHEQKSLQKLLQALQQYHDELVNSSKPNYRKICT